MFCRLRAALLVIFVAIIVSACESTQEQPVVEPTRAPQSAEDSVQRLLDLADASIPGLANNYLIQAMELLIEQGRYTAANELVGRISLVGSFGNEHQIRLSTIQAEIALNGGNPQAALDYLDAQPTIDTGVLDRGLQSRIYDVRAQAYSDTDQYSDALRLQVQQSTLRPNLSQFNQNQIWQSQ